MYNSHFVHQALSLYIKTLFRCTARYVLHLEVGQLQKGMSRANQLAEPIPLHQIDTVMEMLPCVRYSKVTTDTPLLSRDGTSIDYVLVDDYCYTLLFSDMMTLDDMQHFRLISNAIPLL